ncbi:DUF2127 domain-containing protein [Clostridium sp. JN-9]|uniref:DUF2127 domain-containing protein n=1 Tax=Clostridium sp. JN-9 TaxID=2507159 RepID=UPI000FFDFCA6|nr:DUF2127 domain-containing protein [Clostridium sp. JN-9]QAT39707.1 DUF2127 domain-containing protein [Clostridium sp. JN-9]
MSKDEHKENKLKVKSLNNKEIAHKGFELGILLKCIDGILEIIGGFLLMFLNPNRLNKLVVLLTQHELSEDPRDKIARYLINFSSKFTVSTQNFGVFYLISHGLIKLVLVFLLWKRKIWAYPITIISFVLFIVYQLYRYTIYHSILLIALSVFDAVMIVLTIIEYKRIKDKFKK